MKTGFTLVELSIILLIIGLVIGGIMVGHDLIKSSEIRSQITQIEEFKAATITFRTKYGYLPGDMPPSQAQQIGFFAFTGAWAGKDCPAGLAFGNNDGIISFVNEEYAFWSHLSDAKIIKGNYAGIAGSLLNTNAASCLSGTAGNPLSPINNDYFFPHSKLASTAGYITAKGNNYNAPGRDITYSNAKLNNLFSISDLGADNNLFTAYELYQIDSKIDDGLPKSGTVRDRNTADFGAGSPLDDPPCTTSGLTPTKYDTSVENALNCMSVDFLF